MEKGFYHHSTGYWQTSNDPSSEIRGTYPTGTIEVPLKPSTHHEWVDGAWVENSSVRIASQAAAARAKRNSLLAQSDWTQIADAPVDQPSWAVYRQSLRDVTQQSGFPEIIDWPIAAE